MTFPKRETAPPSQYPADVLAEAGRRFPQDFPAHAIALADATIERTRGDNGITVRRAIAELVVSLQDAVVPRHVGGTTARQQAGYAFICDYIQTHGYSPSFDEIKAAIGIGSKSGVNRIVSGLVERGLLRHVPGRARSIQIAGA